MPASNSKSRLLQAARLWARTSAKGQPYMIGRLGGLRVLVMPAGDRQTDRDPTHVLLVGPAPERPDDGGER